MAQIERLTAADHAAVGRLLLEAYADYAARMGSEWPRLRDGLVQAPVRVLGVQRILFAADFPYEDDAEAVRFMDGAEVSEDERRQIYETNARRVFKLKV